MKPFLISLFLLSSFVGWGQNLRLHRYKWNKGAEVRGPVKEVKDSTVVSDWVIIQTVEYDKRKRNYYQIDVFSLTDTSFSFHREYEYRFSKRGRVMEVYSISDSTIIHRSELLWYRGSKTGIIEVNYRPYYTNSYLIELLPVKLAERELIGPTIYLPRTIDDNVEKSQDWDCSVYDNHNNWTFYRRPSDNLITHRSIVYFD